MILAFLCVCGAVYYRRLYRSQQNAEELRGEVVAFETYRGWRGQEGWKYYELIVEANGKSYKIRTDNTKAKKYQIGSEVTILVPENDTPPIKTLPTEENRYPTAVIIKEDQKKAWHVVFFWIMGGFFTVMFLVALISEILQ